MSRTRIQDVPEEVELHGWDHFDKSMWKLHLEYVSVHKKLTELASRKLRRSGLKSREMERIEKRIAYYRQEIKHHSYY